jgi:hypothetical protein
MLRKKPVPLRVRATPCDEGHITDNATEDPFGGAGSTMVACENLGRHACLIEIDPRYVDCTIRRWQRYTNRRAHLVGAGKSFGEIESERLTPSVIAGDSK